MKEDFNDIDQLFKEKLLNITPESALSEAELWNNVQSQLPRKRSKFIFWWIGAILLLLGIGAAAVYYSNPNKSSVVATNDTSNIDSQQKNSDAVVANKNSSTNTSSSSEIKTNTTAQNAAGANSSKAVTQADNKVEKKTKNKNKKSEVFSMNADEIRVVLGGLPDDILIPFDSPSIVQEVVEINTEIVNRIPLNQNDSLATADGEIEKTFQIASVKNPLLIGAYGFVNTVLLNDRMNVRYENQIGNGVGVSVGKSKNRMYWSAAAEWSNNKYLFNYEEHKRIPYTYYNFPVEIILDPNSLPDTIFQDTTVMADYSRIVKHNNSFKTASARFEVGHVFGTSAIRPTAGFGVGIHYIYNQSGRYLMENNDVSLLSENSLGLKKFTYSPYLKLGLEYQLNQRMTFTLSTRADWYSRRSWLNSGDKAIVVPAVMVGVGFKL
ncbi:MAG: hypothetical protein RL204_1149 [Bacteroidota bacterium]|jgi:hypothetical protein